MNIDCSDFKTAQLEFQYDMLQKTAAIMPDKSFVLSPLSITMSLAMILMGASNETANEYKLFNKIGKDKVAQCFQKILRNTPFEEGKSYSGLINHLYLHNNLTEDDYYKSLLNYYFKNEIKKIDFSNPSKAAEELNKFISNVTNNTIQDAFEPSSIHESTRFMGLSIVDFEANWKYAFLNTTTKQFYDSENCKKEVKTMLNSVPFLATKMYNATIISLPFSKPSINTHKINSNLTMYIILPDENNNDLHFFLQNLSYENFVNMINAVNKAVNYVKQLYLPKFKVTSKIDVKKILKEKMNIGKVFSEDNKNIVKNENLKLDEIYQTTTIAVEEQGDIKRNYDYALRYFPRCEINRPFVYFIMNELDEIILNGVTRIDSLLIESTTTDSLNCPEINSKEIFYSK